MPEVVSILDPQLIQDLNENHHLVEVDQEDVPPPSEEEIREAEIRRDWVDAAEEDEMEGVKPPYLDMAEYGMEGEQEGMSEAEMANLAQGFTDFSKIGKDILEDYYEEAFAKSLKREFGEGKRMQLIILQVADLKANLDFTGISAALTEAKKHDKRFEGIDFIELMEMGLKFRRLKKRYSSKPMQPYQEEGIERYAKLTIEKYLKKRPDPLLLLVIYLGLTFGVDVFRLGKIEYQNWREQKAEKKAA